MLKYICLVIVLTILIDLWLRNSDFFEPFRFYLFVHAFGLGIASLKLDEAMTPFLWKTNILYYGSGLTFLIGTCIPKLLSKKIISTERVVHDHVAYFNVNKYLMLVLPLVVVFLIGIVVSVIIVGEVPLLAKNKLEALIQFQRLPFSVLVLLSAGPTSMFLIFIGYLVSKSALHKNIFLTLIFLVVGSFALTFSRSGLLFFMFTALTLYNYYRKKINVRILFLSGLFVILFVLITSYFKFQSWQAESSVEITFSQAIEIVAKMPYVYVANNFWNLDYALNNENFQTGHPTTYGFSIFGSLLDYVYLGSIVGPLFRDYMGYESAFHEKSSKVKGLNTVGYQWELYKDFGTIGVFVLPFIYGFFMASLYYFVTTRPTIFNCSVYSFLMFSILTSFSGVVWVLGNYLYGFIYMAICLFVCSNYKWHNQFELRETII